MKRGRLISFEGIDGCGKSTQAKLLHERFLSEGVPTLLTKEPGGARLGEALRKILLGDKNLNMAIETEVYLYAADRAEHVREVILPALAAGKTVVTDRFLDSSLAYQGALGFDVEKNLAINAPALAGVLPDLTVLLKISPEDAAKRNRNERKLPDRIEARAPAYHEKVAEIYAALSERFSERYFTVDASLPAEELHEKIAERCKAL
jgi:dTMP kinase